SLYVASAATTVLTVTSLTLGFPIASFSGQEVSILMAVTLLVFVVGMIGLVDYLRWPYRRDQPPGVRIMSAGVVMAGFVLGYITASRISLSNNPVHPTDPLPIVVGPDDPLLSIAGGVLVACMAAFLGWVGLGRAE